MLGIVISWSVQSTISMIKQMKNALGGTDRKERILHCSGVENGTWLMVVID